MPGCIERCLFVQLFYDVCMAVEDSKIVSVALKHIYLFGLPVLATCIPYGFATPVFQNRFRNRINSD